MKVYVFPKRMRCRGDQNIGPTKISQEQIVRFIISKYHFGQNDNAFPLKSKKFKK